MKNVKCNTLFREIIVNANPVPGMHRFNLPEIDMYEKLWYNPLRDETERTPRTTGGTKNGEIVLITGDRRIRHIKQISLHNKGNDNGTTTL